MGSSVSFIDTSAFYHCTALKSIYFTGDAPEFGEYAFSGTTTTAYYPAGNTTWTANVRLDYDGNITWKAYSSSGSGEDNDSNNADTLLVRRGNWFYVNYTLKGGNADMSFTYGKETDEVLIGDWDGDGYDTLCIRRGNHYYINNTLEGGNASIDFIFGKDTDEVYTGTWI